MEHYKDAVDHFLHMLRTSGTSILCESGQVIRLHGVVDTTALIHRLNNESYCNHVFGTTVCSTDEYTGPTGPEFYYWYTLFWNMVGKQNQTGAKWVYRVGGHDTWGMNSWLAAWEANPTAVINELTALCDAAAQNGAYAIITLGGFSDGLTTNYDLFTVNSNKWNTFVSMAAGIADALYGRPGVGAIELTNEPDYFGAIQQYWGPQTGWNGSFGNAATVSAIAKWSQALVAAVRAKQAKPGALLCNGIAIASNIYAWTWTSADYAMMASLWAGYDLADCHLYYENQGNNYWQTKAVTIMGAANAANKPTFNGETGDLWNDAGDYDANVDAYFWNNGWNFTELKPWWTPTTWVAPNVPPETGTPPATPTPTTSLGTSVMNASIPTATFSGTLMGTTSSGTYAVWDASIVLKVTGPDGTVTTVPLTTGTGTTNGGNWSYTFQPKALGTYSVAVSFAGDATYGPCSWSTKLVLSST